MIEITTTELIKVYAITFVFLFLDEFFDAFNFLECKKRKNLDVVEEFLTLLYPLYLAVLAVTVIINIDVVGIVCTLLLCLAEFGIVKVTVKQFKMRAIFSLINLFIIIGMAVKEIIINNL
jgi:hypothetical protein